MNIGIDASRAFEKERTGIEEYSYQLIKNLAMMDLKSHQIFLYARKNLVIDFDLPDNFKLKIISPNKFWTQIGLASEMLRNKIDVLFVPAYAVPQIHPSETVVTIHGLEYKYFPECYSLKERMILEINTKLSIKLASKIIVPSENTKKDLIKFYGVEEGKINVVYHGVNSNWSKGFSPKVKQNNLVQIRAEALTPKIEFNVLFLGRLEKRKNIVNLVKAFELFKNQLRRRHSGMSPSQLILVGKAGFGFEEIKTTIQESQFKKDIILKDYISESEKEELYQNADLFILPSFYEGFGLPVLEAMSYGVPVVCSNTSSLPEVAGGAALLIDPNNIQEISEAMSKVFSNSDLKNKMIEKGFENIRRFSWEKCVRETMEVLLN